MPDRQCVEDHSCRVRDISLFIDNTDASMYLRTFIFLSMSLFLGDSLIGQETQKKYNVLLIISDDLTSTALGCYGNRICKTPSIDKLATEGTRFSRAYCQATVCAPSRASFMFGYYPYATKATGYTSGRKEVGPDKDSWAQHFRKNGYHSARISKVFHMGVPTDIAPGKDGADDGIGPSSNLREHGIVRTVYLSTESSHPASARSNRPELLSPVL